MLLLAEFQVVLNFPLNQMSGAVGLGKRRLRGIPLTQLGPSQSHALGLCKWTRPIDSQIPP